MIIVIFSITLPPRCSLLTGHFVHFLLAFLHERRNRTVCFVMSLFSVENSPDQTLHFEEIRAIEEFSMGHTFSTYI